MCLQVKSTLVTRHVACSFLGAPQTNVLAMGLRRLSKAIKSERIGLLNAIWNEKVN